MGSKIIRPDFNHEHFLVAKMDDEELLAELDVLRVGDDSNEEDFVELVDHDQYLATLRQLREQYFKSYAMTVQLRGEVSTRRVWLFEQEIFAEESIAIRNHSPSGFFWGYTGSGPAQLALAICVHLFGKHRAMDEYQNFKFKYIANLPKEDFEIDLKVDLPAPTLKAKSDA